MLRGDGRKRLARFAHGWGLERTGGHEV
jgi:hypothetical protein